MSEEQVKPPVRDFQEIPTWSPSEKFEITGAQFQELHNFYELFFPFMQAFESVFRKGVMEKKITPVYQNQDGTIADPEKVKKYQEDLAKYFQHITEMRAEKEEKPLIITSPE